MSRLIEKIVNAKEGTFIIFISKYCVYSKKALEILENKKLSHNIYDIDNIDGGLEKILKILNKNNKLIDFKSEHRTKPIIFLNGKFLGGMTELDHYVNNMNI